MPKKTFESIDTRNQRKPGKVEQAMSQATSKRGQQPKATEEEAKERRKNMKTQGRNGAKLKRINMAFSDENYDFIYTVGRFKNLSITAYVNEIIAAYRETHGVNEEILQQLRELMEKIDAIVEAAPDEDERKRIKKEIDSLKQGLADKF